LIMLVLVAVVIGGCSFDNNNEQKVQAYQRYHRARAHAITGVGNEHLRVGDLDKAKSSAAEALALDRQSVPARILLGKVLLEKGRYAEAAEELRKAEMDASEDPEIPYLLGVALEKRGEYAEALKAYQKARALDPTNEAYITASAEALTAWGKPRLALELLQTRLERTEGNPSMLALAGELAMLVGEPAKAARFYQYCLDANAGDLGAREGLAEACFFAGQYAESLEALKQLAAHPAYRDKASWVYIVTGDCHMALDRPRQACLAYEAAARIDPAEVPVWISLAKACVAAGDAQRATSAAGEALALEPDSADAKLVLAYAMLTQGSSGQAAKILAEQAKKNPKDPMLLCMLGRCYAGMGRKDRAVSCYVQALRCDPDHRLAKTLLATTGLHGDRPR
jgi:tetratricopeptide (TPR) repeat protein